MAELWKRHLDVTEIDHTASFVDLGGNSLLAMRAMAEINRTFATWLSVRMLLVSSLSQVAAEIDSRLAAGRHDQAEGGNGPVAERSGLAHLATWFKERFNVRGIERVGGRG